MKKVEEIETIAAYTSNTGDILVSELETMFITPFITYFYNFKLPLNAFFLFR
mgnify:CR=1 FL=1